MANRARCLATSVLILLGGLTSIGRARAADYSVDFAVRTDHGDEVGSVTCSFGDSCIGRMESLGLYFDIIIDRSQPEEATVFMHSYEVGCCFFDGAAASAKVDSSKRLSLFPFYKGHAARGGLFIENHYAGTLYVNISFTSSLPKRSKNK
jgi:hypothetical protein